MSLASVAFPIRYLLDTNVLRELVVGSDNVYDIEAKYGLFARGPRYTWVPYVVRAELLVLGRNWDDTRQENFLRVMRQFSEISFFDDALMEAYVSIDSYSRNMGRRMGKNDLWIAATALVYDFTILTHDQDFAHLSGIGISVEFAALATAGVTDDR